MTTPDYRAALAELVEAVDRLLSQGESPANPGSRLILTVHVEDLGALADRARTLLAAPEVVGARELEWPASVAQGCHKAAAKAELGSPMQQLLVAAGDLLESYPHWALPLPEAQR